MAENSLEYDFLAKIIIIGEPCVGKTSIWHRYFHTKFPVPYNCTIGVDVKMKTINVEGKRVKLYIWDTAGQERFTALSHVFYRGTIGVFLCYAINKRESFERIGYWMEEAKKYAREENVCFVLVGTKSDLSNERVVSIDEGRQLAESLGIKFFETSAKENVNINEAFLTLARDIKEVLDNKKDDVLQGIQIDPKENNSRFEINCFKCS